MNIFTLTTSFFLCVPPSLPLIHQVVFVDHHTQRTTYIDPRLPYPGNNLSISSTSVRGVAVSYSFLSVLLLSTYPATFGICKLRLGNEVDLLSLVHFSCRRKLYHALLQTPFYDRPMACLYLNVLIQSHKNVIEDFCYRCMLYSFLLFRVAPGPMPRQTTSRSLAEGDHVIQLPLTPPPPPPPLLPFLPVLPTLSSTPTLLPPLPKVTTHHMLIT